MKKSSGKTKKTRKETQREKGRDWDQQRAKNKHTEHWGKAYWITFFKKVTPCHDSSSVLLSFGNNTFHCYFLTKAILHNLLTLFIPEILTGPTAPCSVELSLMIMFLDMGYLMPWQHVTTEHLYCGYSAIKESKFLISF